jgi:hypothetical protein
MWRVTAERRRVAARAPGEVVALLSMSLDHWPALALEIEHVDSRSGDGKCERC